MDRLSSASQSGFCISQFDAISVLNISGSRTVPNSGANPIASGQWRSNPCAIGPLTGEVTLSSAPGTTTPQPGNRSFALRASVGSGYRRLKFNTDGADMKKKIWMAVVGAAAFMLGACDDPKNASVPTGTADTHQGQNTSETIRTAEPVDEFREGTRVLARWPLEDWYYPATVSSVENSRYYITYRDGDTAWVERSDLRLERVSLGSRVYCNWKNSGTYFPGVISARRGDAISINYDDGDYEETSMRCIRMREADI